MDDGPFAAFAHPNGNRFHDASTVRLAISGLDVQMHAVQTVGAMVSMLGSGARADNQHSAVSTVKPSTILRPSFYGGTGINNGHFIGGFGIAIGMGPAMTMSVATTSIVATAFLGTQLCFSFLWARSPEQSRK